MKWDRHSPDPKCFFRKQLVYEGWTTPVHTVIVSLVDAESAGPIGYGGAPVAERDLGNALRAGVAFLLSRQLPSGQFPVEATIEEPPETLPDQSLFATTHIVYSLGFVPGEDSQAMIHQAMRYFLAEMSGQGLWRYWNKDAVWGGRRIYSFIPADLDDTANVSYLLRRHQVAFPDNQRLLLVNRNRAGLFYTWLTMRPALTWSPDYWWAMAREMTLPRMTIFWKTTEAGYRDVDAVVNANALLYLGLRPETEAIVAWLIEIIRAEREACCDKWYRDAFSLYYALSRCFHAGVLELGATREAIVERLQTATASSGQIGQNTLQTALSLNTLFNFGAWQESTAIRGAVHALLNLQAEDGSWPSAPYYYGGPKKAVSWGSAELTTGLCLEALARYADSVTQVSNSPSQ